MQISMANFYFKFKDAFILITFNNHWSIKTTNETQKGGASVEMANTHTLIL